MAGAASSRSQPPQHIPTSASMECLKYSLEQAQKEDQFEPPRRCSNSADGISFPWRLHEVLEAAEQEGFSHIVSWLPGNTSFRVRNIKAFEEHVIPRYLSSMTVYKSFVRQLNLYCFIRVPKGPARGSYHHPQFLRHRKSLCNKMALKKIKGVRSACKSKQAGHCKQRGGAQTRDGIARQSPAPKVAGATETPTAETALAGSNHHGENHTAAAAAACHANMHERQLVATSIRSHDGGNPSLIRPDPNMLVASMSSTNEAMSPEMDRTRYTGSIEPSTNGHDSVGFPEQAITHAVVGASEADHAFFTSLPISSLSSYQPNAIPSSVTSAPSAIDAPESVASRFHADELGRICQRLSIPGSSPTGLLPNGSQDKPTASRFDALRLHTMEPRHFLRHGIQASNLRNGITPTRTESGPSATAALDPCAGHNLVYSGHGRARTIFIEHRLPVSCASIPPSTMPAMAAAIDPARLLGNGMRLPGINSRSSNNRGIAAAAAATAAAASLQDHRALSRPISHMMAMLEPTPFPPNYSIKRSRRRSGSPTGHVLYATPSNLSDRSQEDVNA